MTPAEWIDRCAARVAALNPGPGISPRLVATTLAERQAELYGASGAAWQNPEAAAEKEADEEDEP